LAKVRGDEVPPEKKEYFFRKFYIKKGEAFPCHHYDARRQVSGTGKPFLNHLLFRAKEVGGSSLAS